MDKQKVIYSYNGILFSYKKEKILTSVPIIDNVYHPKILEFEFDTGLGTTVYIS